MRPKTLVLLALAAGFAACKSTPEEAPSDSSVIARDTPADVQPDVTPADVQPADVQSADVLPDDVQPADVQPADVSDASTDASTDARADASTDGPTCVADAGDSGCFACPTSSAEIINRCTGATCARFDNRARLPRLLSDGGVPPLP